MMVKLGRHHNPSVRFSLSLSLSPPFGSEAVEILWK
uniref:Uncharacterized protein n=1 Tax=Arundo donax TaxID=35708 RepID=A0A0A9HDM5_ARUDO